MSISPYKEKKASLQLAFLPSCQMVFLTSPWWSLKLLWNVCLTFAGNILKRCESDSISDASFMSLPSKYFIICSKGGSRSYTIYTMPRIGFVAVCQIISSSSPICSSLLTVSSSAEFLAEIIPRLFWKCQGLNLGPVCRHWAMTPFPVKHPLFLGDFTSMS